MTPTAKVEVEVRDFGVRSMCSQGQHVDDYSPTRRNMIRALNGGRRFSGRTRPP
jgi:hypothetical protein